MTQTCDCPPDTRGDACYGACKPDTSNKADELLASIVQANVDQAAATSDALIDYHKRTAKEIAEALVALFDAVNDCQVVDRLLLRVQKSDVVVRGIYAADQVLKEDETT